MQSGMQNIEFHINILKISSYDTLALILHLHLSFW